MAQPVPSRGGRSVPSRPLHRPHPQPTRAASLERATEWLNSPPLTPSDLRGKVVLVDFWTYTCINWLSHASLRPRLVREVQGPGTGGDRRAHAGVRLRRGHGQRPLSREGHADRLSGRGRQRTRHLECFQKPILAGIVFHRCARAAPASPIWRGLLRAVREDHPELLSEAGAERISHELVSVDGSGVEAPADWSNLKSPENYLGYERTQNFRLAGGATLAEPRAYGCPAPAASTNGRSPGDWTVSDGAVAARTGPNGRIAYRFHARDLHLVMGPAAPGASVRFRVRIDGQPPGAAHGVDVDEEGKGMVTEQRLYQLIRQPGADRGPAVRDRVPRSRRGGLRFTFG